MGKIYMIGVMKGGVGKTVTTFNLVYALQKMGKRALAVDFDPQANLTTCFGADEVGTQSEGTGVTENDPGSGDTRSPEEATIGELMMGTCRRGKSISGRETAWITSLRL